MLTDNLTIVLNQLIKDVKSGKLDLEAVERECEARGIYLSPGTHSRLLQAAADHILSDSYAEAQ